MSGFLEKTWQGFLWPGQTFHNPLDQPTQLSDQASEQEYIMRAVQSILQDLIDGDWWYFSTTNRWEGLEKWIVNPPVVPLKVGEECVWRTDLSCSVFPGSSSFLPLPSQINSVIYFSLVKEATSCCDFRPHLSSWSSLFQQHAAESGLREIVYRLRLSLNKH